MVSKDDHLVYHILRDWRRADLSEGDRAMLTYAEKLTRTPGQVNADDVEALRAAGFDERNILDVVLITAKFAFMTRLADGVGIRADEKFRTNSTRRDAQVEAELEAELAAGKTQPARA
ncbi:MAG: peroxidase [bacterium]